MVATITLLFGLILSNFYYLYLNSKKIKVLAKQVDDLRDCLIPLYILKRSIDIQIAMDYEDYINVSKFKKELEQLKKHAEDKKIPL